MRRHGGDIHIVLQHILYLGKVELHYVSVVLMLRVFLDTWLDDGAGILVWLGVRTYTMIPRFGGEPDIHSNGV